MMRYCNRACQRRMWNAHKLECKQYVKCGRLPIAHVRLILRIISVQNEMKDNINSLVSHENEILADINLMEVYHTFRMTLFEFSEGKLPLSEEAIFQLFCRIKINSFMITDANGADVGLALYLRAARLDHSCIPDVQYIFCNQKIVMCRYSTSSLSIKPRINYYDCMTTTEERQTNLMKNYYFKCDCSLCLDTDREKKITSLKCCSPECLSEPIPFEKLPSSVKLKDGSEDSAVKPAIVRYCPVCLEIYDNEVISQVAGCLYGKTEVCPDIDIALDAIIMYARCCQINKSLQNIHLTSIQDNEDVKYHHRYYKLFGHQDSLYLARCCSRAQCITTMSMDLILNNLTKRNHHYRNEQQLEMSKDTFVNIVIACSLTEFYWRLNWLPSDCLRLGQLMYSVASFLLCHIDDVNEFHNCRRMDEIKSFLLCNYDDNNKDNKFSKMNCLGHVLCKFSKIAYDLLSPFAEYRPDWQQGLSILEHYKAQDILTDIDSDDVIDNRLQLT
uniref:MYND-type domain-containing protein n=1 Tax=Trichobilharzia regenti TaxID=157069 RepID=A0AA85K2G6_TRIRE|nr:unnamed protein product [Trichobilharzia regenti]